MLSKNPDKKTTTLPHHHTRQNKFPLNFVSFLILWYIFSYAHAYWNNMNRFKNSFTRYFFPSNMVFRNTHAQWKFTSSSNDYFNSIYTATCAVRFQQIRMPVVTICASLSFLALSLIFHKCASVLKLSQICTKSKTDENSSSYWGFGLTNSKIFIWNLLQSIYCDNIEIVTYELRLQYKKTSRNVGADNANLWLTITKV